VNSFRHGFWNEHRVVICAQRSAGIAAWNQEHAFLFSEQPPDYIGAQAPKGSQLFRRKMPFGERAASGKGAITIHILGFAGRQANSLLAIWNAVALDFALRSTCTGFVR
jgi:hypothetical protein